MDALSGPALPLLALLLGTCLVWWIIEPHFTQDPEVKQIMRALLVFYLAWWTLFFCLQLFHLLKMA